MALVLKSVAFNSGDRLPSKYTCDGEGVSPPLEWSGVPDGTASLALILDDPDAPRGVFCHWLLYNMPPDLNGLSERARPDRGYSQGRNDYGNTGFGPPCPPTGSTHRYYFRLYALDQTLDMQQGATRVQVIDRMQDHILERTEMITEFGRSRGGAAKR
jgi:Raf kinase inhibitor-like YbhB/YbcL family protein